jgi:O-antigen/teichoic acid export membrane protein
MPKSPHGRSSLALRIANGFLAGQDRPGPDKANSLLPSEIQSTGVAIADKAAADVSQRGGLPAQLLGADRSVLWRKLLPWAHKGGLTILDQGLISGSNFLVSVLLARWLTAEQYGAYAIAFGFFVLLQLVYQSLVMEPMSVFGGSTYRNNLRGYFASLLWIHVLLSFAICLVFGTSAGVSRLLGQTAGMPGALAGVTIASPCVLFFWMARRSFYLELSPNQAVVGAVVYSSFVLSALWFFYHHQLLSAFTAFILIAIGSLGTGSFLMLRLRLALRPQGPRPPTAIVWRQHWTYGAWALMGCFASWIPANIFYPILGSFGTMAQSGQLKALMNLTLPLEQTKAALSMLLLPYAAGVQDQQDENDDGSRAKILSLRMTVLGLGIAIVYWALIIPLDKPLFHLLYSGHYMEVAHHIPLVAVGSIFWSAAYGPALALRGMKSPASVFAAYTFAAVASLVIGVPATWAFGLTGGIWGNNIADIASFAAVSFLLYRKLTRRPTRT